MKYINYDKKVYIECQEPIANAIQKGYTLVDDLTFESYKQEIAAEWLIEHPVEEEEETNVNTND